ncbi:ribonuclease [Polymorphobacter sp.]|uniref:ribonuclease n=1 Tax=Polymorphobacter sp. TaxID=1909290 RepID=UPI003F6E4ACC
MAEALLEAAPGAVRALVLDGATLLEAHLERTDAGPLPGARHLARLTHVLVPRQRGIARLACGTEVLLSPLPLAAEGGLVALEITRAALPEAGRPRLARARPLVEAPDGHEAMALSPGPPLAARLEAAGHAVRTLPLLAADDALEAHGWGEVVAEAESGHVRFPAGLLTISLTPAMTVIDVDGTLPPPALAEAACVPLAMAIRRLGLAGSIAIDFPTLQGAARKAHDRQLAEALAVHLPPPYEVTTINGFGLVQLVRPHRHPGLMESARTPGHRALALLREAARGGPGAATLTGPPALIEWLTARPALVEETARARGGPITLQADPGLATSAAHVS